MMRLVIRLLIVIVLLVVIAAAYSYQEYQRFLSTPINGTTEQIFTIQPGSNLQQVSRSLTEQGISPLPAEYLYWFGRYQQQAHHIKAGEYVLPIGATLPELLTLFVSGEVKQHAFTIVEGMTTQQLLSHIAADARITHTLKDPTMSEVMTLMGAPDRHGEGEFAPETYYFSSGTTDIALLKRAYQHMQTILSQAWANKADNLPYKSPYEALIMASIIEKETGIAEERTEISGVFVRRLQIGMRLQTDPTVIYGMGDTYQGNIRRKDLITDTPYNTYTRHGLPPSPIALPSQAAIIAALNPADGESLYFVATGNEGRHVFSKTLTEHNKAVKRYQLKQ